MPGGMVCLPTRDPLLCEPGEKAEREIGNTMRQLLYVEDLIAMGVLEIRESHVLEFQRIAVEGIFPCGGLYRTLTRTAELQGGGVTHVLPEPTAIPGHVHDALDVINKLLAESREEDVPSGAVVRAAAYALWRFNWIHPFAGGNGRTARALAYLVVCIDFGRALPGRPSMPTLIAGRPRTYQAALRAADAAEARGEDDFDAMTRLVYETVTEQLQHAVRKATAGFSLGAPSPSAVERARRKAVRKSSRDARRRNRK